MGPYETSVKADSEFPKPAVPTITKKNMQNNFVGQNIIVNQQGMPVGHSMMNQNNGPMVNSMNHDGQMNQMGHGNEQQLTGNNQPNLMGIQQVQHVQQAAQVVQQPMSSLPQSSAQSKVSQNTNNTGEPIQIVTKQRLQDLVREIDQTLNLEEEVEEILLTYVDEFVDKCLNGAAMIAKNRHTNSIEVKDVQQYLTRNYNMWTPGFGTDELKPYKKSLTTEAHKQRTALIRKTVKKY